MDEDFVLLLALAGVFIVFFIWFITPEEPDIEKDYIIEEYIVQKYDTFWAIYKDRYSNIMSYREALEIFKEDNDMGEYRLIEGEVVYLRRYKHEM